MSNSPLVSVLLPFYNSEKYLKSAIQSILQQTYFNFELLLLDDGSTDGSLNIAKEFAQQDARIQVHHHSNMGLCKTLQKGVELVKGKYIARMDGDDIALPQRFELQVNYLEKHPNCVALGTALTIIDPENDVLCMPEITQEHEQLVAELLQWKGSRICHPTVMMRTDVVQAVGGYVQEYHFEDVDLFLRLAKQGKLANLSERLLQYRWHIGSVSHTRNHARINEIKRSILNKASAELGLSIPELHQESSKCTTSTSNTKNHSATPAKYTADYEAYCKWCLVARQSGFYGSSLKYLIRAFQSKPFTAKSYWLLLGFLLGEQTASRFWNSLIGVKRSVQQFQQFMIRA
jgi:glycosyltransferase involved in cell wall biosynthesis